MRCDTNPWRAQGVDCARVWRKVRSLRTAKGRSRNALLIGVLFSLTLTSACGGGSQLLTSSGSASSSSARPGSARPGSPRPIPAATSPTAAIGSANIANTGPISGSSEHRANLSWGASPSMVDGYEVYRSNQSGGPYTRITTSPVLVNWFSDTSVSAGQTYYYVVTAVAAAAESVYSNEIAATIPAP